MFSHSHTTEHAILLNYYVQNQTMHIFVFIKYLPSTDMRSTNTRYYALPGFVRNTSTFKTMDYHVSRYHADCLLL